MQILTASSSIVLVQSSCAIRATALRISLVALSPLSLRVFITIATFTYTGKNVHYKMIILRATGASIKWRNCKKNYCLFGLQSVLYNTHVVPRSYKRLCNDRQRLLRVHTYNYRITCPYWFIFPAIVVRW